MLRRVRRALLTATATTAMTAGAVFGGAHVASALTNHPVMAATVTPAAPSLVTDEQPVGPAYWLVGGDGGVFSYGNGAPYGSLGNRRLNAPIVGGAAAPSGTGYWLLGADGGVFGFGNTEFHGSTGGMRLNSPIVNMAATPSGHGYWLVGADGGVFAFGDASFYGSTGGMRLNSRIVAIAASPTGHGYTLVAADGGVFAFGDAGYYGSAGNLHLNSPVTDAAVTPSGHGYWLFANDGGVFAFGDAGYFGSRAGARLNGPIVAGGRTWDGAGYWLVGADGGVFAFGDAGWYGGMASRHLNKPIVALLSSLAPALPPAPAGLGAGFGYDISWPQCNLAYPTGDFGVGVVGVNGGRSFTSNPCLADQFRWASASGRAAGLYMNLNGPTGGSDPYQYGGSAASDAVARANAAGAHAPMMWIDVETMNVWSASQAVNAAVVQGAIDRLRGMGFEAGVYSTSYQWGIITGSYRPGVPVWVAGAVDVPSANAWCSGSHGFGGGETWMVQTVPLQYDYDVICSPAVAHAASIFTMPLLPAAPLVHLTPPDPAPAPPEPPKPHLTAEGTFKASA